MLYSYKGIWPDMEDGAYTAPTASIIGEVMLAAGSSCWFGSVLRGDEAKITVGRYSNIQDNCVLHCDRDVPVVIGEYVTVGHGVILHSCEIGDHAMIGMGATVLSRAKIGEGAVVAAGAVVREGEIVPPYTLYAGIPATFRKELDPSSKEQRIDNAMEYIKLMKDYVHMEGKEWQQN